MRRAGETFVPQICAQLSSGGVQSTAFMEERDRLHEEKKKKHGHGIKMLLDSACD